MITDNGKRVLSKYLLGQAPSYATHIAIGCGAIPLDGNDVVSPTITTKEVLDFEMLRVPISSRGFVEEVLDFSITNKQLSSNTVTLTTSPAHSFNIGDIVTISDVGAPFDGQFFIKDTPTSTTFTYECTGTNVNSTAVSPPGIVTVNRTKIALTAELPTENRYQITEVGLWSSASNSLARGFDSHIIFDFQESWQIHDTSIRDIPVVTTLGDNVDIEVPNDEPIFIAPNNLLNLQTSDRLARKEGSRFLNRSIYLRGDTSEITGASGSWALSETSTHIHLNSINLNISQNSPSDVLKLAFSLVDKVNLGSGTPNFVKILVEFYRNEINVDNGYAKMEIFVDGSAFTNNRYKSISVPISELFTSPDFSPTEIRIARLSAYIAVTDPLTSEEVGSEDHWIALDGLRIENISTENPLYKLVGYTNIKNDAGVPVTKFENTNNYVEFRFSLGVS